MICFATFELFSSSKDQKQIPSEIKVHTVRSAEQAAHEGSGLDITKIKDNAKVGSNT